MSFLLRRNLPLARAGFYDDFARAVENPVQHPWVHLGDGAAADINSSQELRLRGNFLTADGGGESYEFMPFTPNFGLEMEIWNPVTGAAAQGFSAFFTNTWADIGALFLDVVGVRLLHAPAAGGDTVQIAEYANVYTFSNARAQFTSPVTFNGTTLTLKIWVDDDQFIRVWLNGTYLGAAMVSAAFRLGPGRRCLRFLNTCTNDVWLRWLFHYDRPSDFVDSSRFNSLLITDNFNRANGAVGNGWTVLGSAGQIVSNSYSTTSGTDGSRAIIRDTGITTGRQRVEAVVGGALGPNNSADSGLVLCSNSAGTQGLVANVFGNAAYISRFSSVLTGNPPTFVDLSSQTGLSISNGDVLAFSVYDGVAWLEQNGNRILYAVDVHAVVPATNQYAGLRVERTLFNDSMAWNSVSLYAA